MSDALRRQLEQLTPDERKSQFDELPKKLGLADPKALNGTTPPTQSSDDLQRYRVLGELLGYWAR